MSILVSQRIPPSFPRFSSVQFSSVQSLVFSMSVSLFLKIDSSVPFWGEKNISLIDISHPLNL